MITSARVMFTESRRSSTHGGTGTIIRITSITEAAATQTCEVDAIRSNTFGRAGIAVATKSRSPLGYTLRPIGAGR